jgi:hypothetical protein
MEEKEIVPPHVSGVQTNTESFKEFETEQEAKDFYLIARERLLDINHWQDIAGKATASFQVTDRNGKALTREVQKGDHLKIDIPGPGSSSGEGYDWVKVEAVENNNTADSQWTAIRVRPATNPLNDNKDVAHFFSDETTSTFIVWQEGMKVTAAVYGRNEKPNTDTQASIDTIRNSAIAAGAISGFSKVQWKSLVNGLVAKE